MNKDNIYSLQNIENYRNTLDSDISNIVKKYSQLIIEYFKFIKENIKITKSKFLNFIIIRGLDTITNVFLYILYFTKNTELTYFHCQKSYYFYIEFVGQISEEEKTFLQLTTRDATIYVYKKTIYEINNELKKINDVMTNDFREKLDIIKIYINLYQIYLLKMINSDDTSMLNIEYLLKIYDKLNNITNKTKLIILEGVIEKLYNKINDDKLFFDVNYLLIKKFLKNQEILKNSLKKINSEEFDNKLLETPEKVVSWIIG
jgi:hypothetical protein